ncbi:hypothetical protein FB446DRAFT_753387 [Lentinula raphanica]|nr:hypothetical protein FB446DRAFT_753387 [Lentinula raphanica]
MTTNRGNAICGYHSINDKRTKNWDTDGNETRPFRCTGVPVVPKKFIKKSDASKEDPSRKGFMNCGCEWKPVLIEFYYLKTGVIRSPTLDYEEGWAAREFLTPRERCLIYGNWEEKTGLRLEDMWRVKEEINPRTGEGLGVFIAEKTEEELLSAQIQVLQERLAQLSVDEDVQEDD